MPPEEADETDNRDIIAYRRFDKMQREYLKTLVCDEVIEEHKKQPLGQHSEPLERILLHFRRLPLADKYAIKRDGRSSTFKIVTLSGIRGAAPRVVEGEEYETIEEAYHGVFLKQIRELMVS